MPLIAPLWPTPITASFNTKAAAWPLPCRRLILAYLVYIFVGFDMAGLAARARLDNAAILLADFGRIKPMSPATTDR